MCHKIYMPKEQVYLITTSVIADIWRAATKQETIDSFSYYNCNELVNPERDIPMHV